MISSLVSPVFLVFFVLFVFGVLIGSFLNVVILRWNTGMSIARGRSGCFSCGKELSWYELLPVASFFMQRGRCRGCAGKISWQYPLVELFSGLSFIVAYLHAHSIPEFILLAALICFYIVIFVYDLRHQIIPDFFSYGAGLIALGLIAVDLSSSGALDVLNDSSALRLVSGPLFFLFFWFFWYISRGTWMGLGDGKLALSVGWALGLYQGIAAFLLSFWIGAIVTLAIMAYQRIIHRTKALHMRSAIPFGPFILASFFIVLVFNLDIQTILSFLAL